MLPLAVCNMSGGMIQELFGDGEGLFSTTYLEDLDL
jgi:hypothetical protein